MSDLQEMIHDATMKAHGQGAAREQERIIKLLETQWLPIADVDACIALIKGEGNG